MKKLILIICLLFPLAVHAKIYILIEEASSKKFPIAVPQFLTSQGNVAAMNREITDLAKKDLEIAGLFKILDESSIASHDNDTTNIDFSKWLAIDANALLKGFVDTKGGKLVIEMRLYDTQTKELLVGKQYTVEKKDYSAAIHRFIDELMKALTGSRGPFASKIATTCGKNMARQIASVGVDGTNFATLTRNRSNNLSPNWSRDGTTIVFTSFAKYWPEIFSISSSGGAMKQLTGNGATNITPAFSPRGDVIAFASSKTGDMEIYLMNTAGKITGRATNVANIDESPAWSPDGSRFAFASERAGNLHLFLANADGSGVTRLTYTGYQNDQPSWSHDGKKIAFTARDRGAFDLFVMNADGSMIQRLTRDEGNNESPSWSPDSRYLVFSRGNSGLYVMMADGNNPMPIPNTGGCMNPDWGPWIQ